jgi:uncharacterized protein YjbI with pentapeptide repeats
VVKQLTAVQNCSTILTVAGERLTNKGTSDAERLDPWGHQSREQLRTAGMIANFLPDFDANTPPTCGAVASALTRQYKRALANAHGIATLGLAGLSNDSEWLRSLEGDVTCHLPSPPVPVGNIEPYYKLSEEERIFVCASLTIRDFSLGQAGDGKLLVDLPHITIKNIRFNSDRHGSVRFPHSQITGGVLNVPYANMDLTGARLTNIIFGNPVEECLKETSAYLMLSGATCTGVDFTGCTRYNWHADNAVFLNVDLSYAIVAKSSFLDAHLEKVCFDNTKAQGIDLRNAFLKNVIWRYSNFSDACLENTRITLDLSDEAHRWDNGFRGAISTIDTLPDRYKTLKNELALSVKQRLTELAVDQPQLQSTIVRLEKSFGV